MPIQLDWRNEQHNMLCFTFKQRWNLADLRCAYQHAYQLVASQPHRVDFILDVRHSQSPISAATLYFGQSRIDTAPLNTGMTALISDEVSITIYRRLLAQLLGRSIQSLNWHFVTTLPDAETIFDAHEART